MHLLIKFYYLNLKYEECNNLEATLDMEIKLVTALTNSDIYIHIYIYIYISNQCIDSIRWSYRRSKINERLESRTEMKKLNKSAGEWKERTDCQINFQAPLQQCSKAPLQQCSKTPLHCCKSGFRGRFHAQLNLSHRNTDELMNLQPLTWGKGVWDTLPESEIPCMSLRYPAWVCV